MTDQGFSERPYGARDPIAAQEIEIARPCPVIEILAFAADKADIVADRLEDPDQLSLRWRPCRA
jgi:hypothetical protein